MVMQVKAALTSHHSTNSIADKMTTVSILCTDTHTRTELKSCQHFTFSWSGTTCCKKNQLRGMKEKFSVLADISTCRWWSSGRLSHMLCDCPASYQFFSHIHQGAARGRARHRPCIPGRQETSVSNSEQHGGGVTAHSLAVDSAVVV